MSDDQPPKLDADRRTTVHRIQNVKKLSPEELDELPFGVIRVDREGVVVGYNAAEEKLAGRSRDGVLGRNFFTDVAPCTNVKEFAGRFRDGIERGKLLHTFPFRFPFERGPVHVMVTFHYEEPDEHAWIFVDHFGS